MVHVKINETSVRDIRFPTSLYADGSDAIHTDPDYSCAYVTIRARLGVDVFEGFGLTFTLGRGTEIVVEACKYMLRMVEGQYIDEIYRDFAGFWRKLTSESQLWIEEPTSPDDILGHAKIAEALRPLGIGVASGEMCANRVIFKQFLQAKAIDFCQIDSARIGGVNEILAVYLMAHKLGVPVCPHAGGVGLCEMVQHLQMWDFISLSGTTNDRMIEFVDQQHEHFVNPAIVENARYVAPKAPGYSTQLTDESILDYEYPVGRKWQSMFDEGIFQRPEN